MRWVAHLLHDVRALIGARYVACLHSSVAHVKSYACLALPWVPGCVQPASTCLAASLRRKHSYGRELRMQRMPRLIVYRHNIVEAPEVLMAQEPTSEKHVVKVAHLQAAQQAVDEGHAAPAAGRLHICASVWPHACAQSPFLTCASLMRLPISSSWNHAAL